MNNARRMFSLLSAASFLAVLSIPWTLVHADESSDFVIKGDPAKGAEIYKMYCASCHGDAGKGDGIAAAALDPKPRNFTDKTVMSTISDKEIFTAIKDGGAAVGKSPLMVAWGPLLQDDQKVQDVAAYVKTLAGP